MKKILLVDDDRLILDILSRIFIKAGYIAFTATSGEQALEMIKRAGNNQFDAILSDYHMPPGMNGTEFIQICRTIQGYKNKPILLISGETAAFLQSVVTKIGADGFFTKPFLPEPIIKCLDDLFHHYESLIGLAGFPEEF